MNTQIAVNLQPIIPPGLIQQAAEEVADPAQVIEAALVALALDPGAILEEAVVDALRTVRAEDPAEFTRYRARAKKINNQFRLADLDRLIGQDGATDDNTMTRLIALARAKCQLHHDADGRGVAVIERDERREVWMVTATGFTEWLRAEYFNQYEAGVPEAALTSAISTIEAIGVHRGDQVEVQVRCAKKGDAYYIDLCDASWRAVKVDASGYEVLDRSPVLFTRNDKMRPLPVPQLGGNIDAIWKYVNVPAHQRPLVIAWLLDSMRPDTAFPVLEFVGEQGSAKSTSQRHLRDLVDPNKVALRGKPKATEDIFVAAANNWVVSYENLSYVPNDEQDALCTLSTGGGFATRLFYTNGEEHVLETKRPVMLNGIAGIVTRPDLIERTIRVDAPSIPTSERREDADITAGWEADRATIFGALLERFSAVLGMLPTVKLDNHQRMADYERLGEASMRVEGEEPGSFSALYAKAVVEGTARALENFGIATALMAFMAEGDAKRSGEWSGTVGGLYQMLSACGTQDRSSWPKSARGLTDQLIRLAPALREQGLEVSFGARSSGGRRISVRLKGGGLVVAAVPAQSPASTTPAAPKRASPVKLRAV
jgi:hypothetical protein